MKKRTMVLILASIITMSISHAAETFKNSVKHIQFNNSYSNNVEMTLYTSKAYSKEINLRKLDSTTYVITLPETNNELISEPQISGNIEKVSVSTIPYSNTNKGYTKILVKTSSNTDLVASDSIYISNGNENPSKNLSQQKPIQNQPPKTLNQNLDQPPTQLKTTNPSQFVQNHQETESINTTPQKATTPSDFSTTTNTLDSDADSKLVKKKIVKTSNQPDNNDVILMVLSIVLFIAIAAYLYQRAVTKLQEITGEQSDIDVDEDKPKVRKAKKVRDTINALDKMYEKPVKMPVKIVTQTAKTEEDSSFVDLDELFQETKSTPDGKTEDSLTDDYDESALDDFLSGFDFEEEEEVVVEEQAFDEEFLNNLLSEDNIKFTKNDIEKIQNLLNSEISEDTMKNISNFVVTNPIPLKPSKNKILENLISEYTINQNITFTGSDVEALRKLINVEIDSDFVTDLKTNPEKLNKMQEEFQKHVSKPHNTSDIITLKVSEHLPNLAEALKKQGKKPIESEIKKPDIVYYSEGYEYSVLNVDDLPDLSVEINNPDLNAPRPSDNIEYSVDGYDTPTLVLNDVPTIEDMLNHPEKYEEKPIKTTTKEEDEAFLLNNITDVTFKPFFTDENKNSDIISQINENDDKKVELVDNNFVAQEETNKEEESTTVFEIQQEFNKISNNIEVITDENDLLSEQPKLQKRVVKKSFKHTKDAEDLLKLIEKQEAERKDKKAEQKISVNDTEKIQNTNKKTTKQEDSFIGTCILDNEIYSIVSTSKISENIGCHLAKNESGYVIIGYIGNKVFKVKNYQKLTKEVIQSRLSEKETDGSAKYIVRIGANKFLLNVNDNKMEYLMDLC